jgi:integrase/recombinase XerD
MRIGNCKIEYLRYCRVEKENCLGTVAKYQDALNKIIAVIGDIEVLDINQNAILELKENMMEQGLSDSRRALIISVLKNFLAYLKNFIGLQVYDYSKIKIPKVRRKPVRILTTQEIEWFIGQLPEITLKDKRFKALVALISICGARIAEILGLRRNIAIDAREAIVCGKGGKFRPIYWDDQASYYLRLYQDARPEWDRSEFLFGTINNGNYGGQWSKGDVNRSFRKWSTKLNKRIHCHLFRSSFLTNCVHEGMSLSAVSRAMGHSDIRTSMRYFAPMTDEQTKETFHEYFRRQAMVDVKVNLEIAQKGGEGK